MSQPLRVLELFAGYGGAGFALKKANIEFECVGFSEIDKFAIQCYQQNHKVISFYEFSITSVGIQPSWTEHIPKNYGDCTQINPETIPDFDLLTGGFPCQSFSVAGKGLGEQDTRGTLFNDIIRIAAAKKPKYMLLENVKGLLSKRHKDTYLKIISELQRIGYHVKVKCLNSKNFGIPQNRERVWFVCYREVEDWSNHSWPKEEELKIFLKDILEDEVDEKYYLSEKQINNLIKNNNMNCHPSGKGMNGKVYSGNIAPTLTTNKGEGNKIIQLNKPKHSNNRIYSGEGISPTLRDMSAGGNRQPFIQVKNATKQGYLEAKQGDGISLEHPNSKTRRGRVQNQLAPTLQCNDAKGVVTKDLTIRKLTPTECFRLMGFDHDQINLEGLSNTQKYKLAGNGWEISLVSKIFNNMFKNIN